MRVVLVAWLVIAAVLPGTALAQSPAESQTASPPSSALPSPPAPSPMACAPVVDPGVLPEWARAGFSDPEPEIIHTLGRSGQILGILFGYPFTAPPRADTNNKILWVAPYVDGSDLVIDAQRMDGVVPVGSPAQVTVVGGPGPSVIDMPEAGCWRFTLTWAGMVDSLDVDYQPLDASAAPSSETAPQSSAETAVP